MLKNILKLEGVNKLEKDAQAHLNGGFWGRRCRVILCDSDDSCGDGCSCVDYVCQS